MIFKSINPFDGSLVNEYRSFTEKEVKNCLENSRQVYEGWKLVSFSDRAECMKKLSVVLKMRVEELSKIITLEMGKPIKESQSEINKCAWVCDYYAKNAEKQLAPEEIKSDAFYSGVTYEPLGAILGIMPWNYPFWQVFRFIAPNLMAGNVVLLKHASNVQGCALVIEECVLEAGFPKNIFKNLSIPSNMVKEVINHEVVKAITLTGSEYAGSQVAGEAGKCIKKTVLELGGNNAFIVMRDANLEKAVDIAVIARMMNGGQSCIAAKRFMVHQEIFEDYIKLFTSRIESLKRGNPMDESCEIGPLSSEGQAKEVEQQVAESIKMGANLVIGGKRSGAFFEPTVLTEVTETMPVFKDEVFGPVAPFIPFNNVDEAIRLSNLSRFGLGVSIITENPETINELIPRFNEGAVFVNSLVKSDPRLPFGGIKKSGYGRELSLHGIREFVNTKTVYVDKD